MNLGSDFGLGHKCKKDQNLIRDSNPDFRINPDPNACWIAPKMYWIHSLVGASHFAQYSKSRPVSVIEILINVLKSPIPQR